MPSELVGGRVVVVVVGIGGVVDVDIGRMVEEEEEVQAMDVVGL